MIKLPESIVFVNFNPHLPRKETQNEEKKRSELGRKLSKP
jgi:hypothetical protein